MDPSFEFDRRDHEQEIDLMANLLFETRRSLERAIQGDRQGTLF